jgi:hypothetical protein
MIDDPDLESTPAAPRRSPRSQRPDLAPSPRGAREDEAEDGLGDPVEPGWGDPFASYAALIDQEASEPGTRDTDARPDPWTIGAAGPPEGEIAAGLADRTDRAAARGGAVGAPGQGSGARRGPLLLALLRPWFDPRPGELRGAIVVLSVALAVSLALWFDASRRPDGSGPVTSDLSAAAREHQPAPAPAPAPGSTPGPTPGVPTARTAGGSRRDGEQARTADGRSCTSVGPCRPRRRHGARTRRAGR